MCVCVLIMYISYRFVCCAGFDIFDRWVCQDACLVRRNGEMNLNETAASEQGQKISKEGNLKSRSTLKSVYFLSTWVFHLDPFGTVDGRIPAPVDIMVALSHYLFLFIHPRWLALGISSIFLTESIGLLLPRYPFQRAKCPSRRFFFCTKRGDAWGINRFQDWPYYVEAQFASDWRGWMLLNVADLDGEIFGLRRLPIDLRSLSRPLQIYGKSLSISMKIWKLRFFEDIWRQLFRGWNPGKQFAGNKPLSTKLKSKWWLSLSDWCTINCEEWTSPRLILDWVELMIGQFIARQRWKYPEVLVTKMVTEVQVYTAKYMHLYTHVSTDIWWSTCKYIFWHTHIDAKAQWRRQYRLMRWICSLLLKAFFKPMLRWWKCWSQFFFGDLQMDVSENSGTPTSSILIGFSFINHPFWGIPIFGNAHVAH